ncbi:MAG TPA: M56 family metallopeptidase, partial [Gemmatimonadaceae bacterium]
LLFQARRLRLAVEMDCDARVLARHAEHDRYGRLLITIAQRQSNLPSALAPTLSEPVSHLERRIRAMTSNSWRFARVRAAGFMLVGAAAIVAACAVHTPDQVTGPKQSPAERAAMAANPNATFFSFDVDKQAALTPGDQAPHYPDSLRASSIQGEVIAQFVVNADGRVDTSTFKVLKSSDELFTQSVRTTVAGWTFSPAQVQGHAVKQVVQQPFTFRLNGAAATSVKVGTPSRPGEAASNLTRPAGANGYLEFKLDSGAKLMPGNVLPHYPDELASAKTEGEVIARFVVGENGRVDTTTFQLLKSTDERFAQAVKRAAATWAYQPATTDGHAVRQLVTVLVYFALTNNSDVSVGAIVVTPSRN